MKLLFVHQYLGAVGGAETDILLTAIKLRSRGHWLALLYREGSGRDEAVWRQTFSRCLPLPEAEAGAQVRRVLADFKPDIIYFHSLAELEVLEAVFESGLPVVRRVHDHRMYCMRGYKYDYFTRAICTRPAGLQCLFPCLAFIGKNRPGRFPLKWVSYAAKKREIALNRFCRRLIVYSRYQKEELVRNGFDPVRIDVHVPIRCWGTDGPVSSFSARNVVLFAGQIIRGKGVDLFLRALARVDCPFEGLVVGDGNHRAACEALARKLRLTDRVRFEGYVPGGELKNYFLESSVLVVSSVWPEPFALVGQEGMRFGVPVVAFDAGGIKEWLYDGENGFLVPWMDVEGMAQRIQQLLQDKELARRLGRRAMELVNREYDASRQIDAIEQIFLSVLRDRSWVFATPPVSDVVGL